MTRPNVGDKVVEEEAGEAETLEGLKARVYVAAKAAAKQHGWCSVVDRVLADVGIEAPAREFTLTIPITVTSTTDLSGRAALGSISATTLLSARRAIEGMVLRHPWGASVSGAIKVGDHGEWAFSPVEP